MYAACTSAFYNEKNCEKIANKVTKKIEGFAEGKKEINSNQIRKKIENELRKINKELAFFYEQHLPNLRRL